MKPSAIISLLAFFIAFGGALVTQASAAPPAVLTGHGAMQNPYSNCAAGLVVPFTLAAEGSGSTLDQSAHGFMSVDTVDQDNCNPVTVSARVDCLLVVGNEAIAFGPITRISRFVPLSNAFYIVVQDNGATGDLGQVVPAFFDPLPTNCSQADLSDLFNFSVFQFVSGDTTIH